MEIIHTILNIIRPPIFASTLFFLPPYLLFKFIFSILRAIFSENVAGKVILITGASSGIGEHLAYEYARRGACLALVARRENRLRAVAEMAYELGSPDVIVIPADISKVEDCQQFVDETVNHFGRLDHLVNNAGVCPLVLFEESSNITNIAKTMDINFWGYVYTTKFALQHLKERKGKIIVIGSATTWLPIPRLSFYSSSKAAVITFFETLRVELGREIGITIVTPGLIESEITQGKFVNKEGKLELDQELRDVEVSVVPIRSAENCAKEIVKSACRGENYLTEPSWIRATFFLNLFCPEIIEWCNHLFLMPLPWTSERDTLSKRILDLTGLKKYVYPESVQFPELKANS